MASPLTDDCCAGRAADAPAWNSIAGEVWHGLTAIEASHPFHLCSSLVWRGCLPCYRHAPAVGSALEVVHSSCAPALAILD